MLLLAPAITRCGVCTDFIHCNSNWCMTVHVADVSSKGWVRSKMTINFAFYYRLSGVILVHITLEKKEMMITRCINVMGRACITTIVSDLWVIAIPSDDVITINSISKVTTWNLDDWYLDTCAHPEVGGGSWLPPPPNTHKKNHWAMRFFSNTGPDPLEKHRATKPAINVGPSSARQRIAIKW